MPERARPLSILARPGFRNRAKNPYNFLLYDGLRARGVRVDEFTPYNWLRNRYDVCHVHWPESTFNASLPEALATTRLLLLALDRLRARGTRVAWTAHNVAAHERRFPRAERAFWAAFTRRVDALFALSESSLERVRGHFPELAARPAFVVPHHHYRGEYPDGLSQDEARARLSLPANADVGLFFGRLLDYKNVPALIETFRAFADGSEREAFLVVAGRPHDRAIERAVRAAACADPRVRLHLEFVQRADAQVFFRASDVVMLPYREILNSGAAILALGFDRPVLLPHAGAGQDLERRLGRPWVRTYERLEPELLRASFCDVRHLPKVTDGAHLAAISPAAVAAETLAAYEAMLDGRGAAPSSGEVP